MALRDCIRPKKQETDKSMEELAVETYEKNMNLYKGKSTTWMVRITADELGMRKDDLCEILENHYGED